MLLGGAGVRRLRCPRRPGPGGRVRRHQPEHLPHAARRHGDRRRRGRRLLLGHRQRQGLAGHRRVLQAGADRAEPVRTDVLLHRPGRPAPGLPEPALARVRTGAGRRCRHPRTRPGRPPVRPGRHGVLRRPGPDLRRTGQWHAVRRRRRRGAAQTARRGPRRRRHRARGDPRFRGQQRRCAEGRLHRPERRRSGHRRLPGHGRGRCHRR